jgi:hypothetical protein
MTTPEPNVIDPVHLGELLRIAVPHMKDLPEYRVRYALGAIRSLWPHLDAYEQRQALVTLQVEFRYQRDVIRPEWEALIEELMSPKAPFSVNYVCDGCGAKDLKLWRGVHGRKDARRRCLLCASCLVPGVTVGDDGKAQGEYGPTDQVGGWLPAVPVDDTFWGYSSVPTSDVRWWRALPTYAKKENGQ